MGPRKISSSINGASMTAAKNRKAIGYSSMALSMACFPKSSAKTGSNRPTTKTKRNVDDEGINQQLDEYLSAVVWICIPIYDVNGILDEVPDLLQHDDLF